MDAHTGAVTPLFGRFARAPYFRVPPLRQPPFPVVVRRSPLLFFLFGFYGVDRVRYVAGADRVCDVRRRADHGVAAAE